MSNIHRMYRDKIDISDNSLRLASVTELNMLRGEISGQIIAINILIRTKLNANDVFDIEKYYRERIYMMKLFERIIEELKRRNVEKKKKMKAKRREIELFLRCLILTIKSNNPSTYRKIFAEAGKMRDSLNNHD